MPPPPIPHPMALQWSDWIERALIQKPKMRRRTSLPLPPPTVEISFVAGAGRSANSQADSKSQGGLPGDVRLAITYPSCFYVRLE